MPTDQRPLELDEAATHLAFRGSRLVVEGSLGRVAQVLHSWTADQRRGVMLFEVATGRVLEIDLQGSAAQVAARYPLVSPITAARADEQLSEEQVPVVRKRGRPKLGVTGREITLLPSHWAWLDTQQGGASATLRRLIDHRREEHAAGENARAAQDRTSRLLSTLASDLPGFDDALAALYARDKTGFEAQALRWSRDLQRIAKRLASDVWRS